MTDEQSATASKRALSDNDELDVDYGLHSAVYHLLMVSADLSSTRQCLIVVCMIEPRAVGASQVEARGCQRAEEAAERETCRGRDDLQRRPQGRRSCGHWPEGSWVASGKFYESILLKPGVCALGALQRGSSSQLGSCFAFLIIMLFFKSPGFMAGYPMWLKKPKFI